MYFVSSTSFAILFGLFALSESAVTHGSHTHGQREKVNDGAFSPRDVHHHSEGKHDNAFDHEAIIGSAKEAAEFDNLAPDEAKARLKDLVGKLKIEKSDSHCTAYGSKDYKAGST
jgi:hypothetical protein